MHPECTHEVVLKADHVGSTEYIIKTIEAAPAGSAWAIGTELNLVQRLAEAHPDKQIVFLDRNVCYCSTMNRIDLPHFVWAMESPGRGGRRQPDRGRPADRAGGAGRPAADARPARQVEPRLTQEREDALFRRSRTEEAPVEAVAPKPGGKGRPTPKRREAEALARAKARPPRDRKELKRRQRELRMEDSRKIRQAMKSGDERYYLPRDRGPVRRFIRDYIDSRFSVVELMIPLLVVSMVLGWSGSPTLVNASSMILLATFLFVIVDMVVLRFRLRRELGRRFPDEPLKGTTYYALMRALQMKFMRLPKPQVKIGQSLSDTYR
ncbi:quinolinate synthase NadA [Nocardioides sp. TF02-7]|uniref:quinolinate synthase NadA n=1 Tax=Nocardioides sp. TF02-7 TaxID=2917724 RepID=UPI001F058389|nr:quinolinate synthase NadA [Nocardioides sp. TF02-7]UMG92032.1 quinolinate synthase NadA [Nocardioides sp. TF02-7]